MKTLLLALTTAVAYTAGYNLGYKQCQNDDLEIQRDRIEFAEYLGRIKDITIFGSPWINTYN